MQIERRTLTVEEVAQYIGVSKDLIYIMVREKSIPFIRIGSRRILFKRESIDQWLSEQEVMAHEQNA